MLFHARGTRPTHKHQHHDNTPPRARALSRKRGTSPPLISHAVMSPLIKRGARTIQEGGTSPPLISLRSDEPLNQERLAREWMLARRREGVGSEKEEQHRKKTLARHAEQARYEHSWQERHELGHRWGR